MEFKNLIFEKDGNIAVLTISRPKALNALNSETLTELNKALDVIEEDNDLYCVIVTGAGPKSFVAGADISEMKDFNTLEGRKFGILGNKVFRRIETMGKVFIAAVNGFALGGGCELSMACDIRVGSTKAKFGQPEVGLGITPGFGGTQRLARIVGLGAAKELIYTAKMIDANEAYRIGLLNKVVEPDKLMDEAKEFASTIASKAPQAVKYSKEAITRGYQCDIDTAVMYESEVFGECFSTEDQKDAMNAFVERKKLTGFKNR